MPFVFEKMAKTSDLKVLWLCYSRSSAVVNAEVGDSVQIVKSLQQNRLLWRSQLKVESLDVLRAAVKLQLLAGLLAVSHHMMDRI